MKAYVYRSGHVMIGPSVPEGAVELADWDNEAELLTVLRWESLMVEGADGSLCMVLECLVKYHGLEKTDAGNVKYIGERIRKSLRFLRYVPDGILPYTVSPIEKWSPESVEASK
ncbi:MAG: hypothetical protein AAB214_07495 [Fibrobacterota bacterium]